MASSKKYGYQLRGNKLAICELDLTGSGNGLNYSYTDNAGLDIATDPSAWKSPLETITNGLQLEYLPSYSKDELLPPMNNELNFEEIIGSEVIADNSFFISMSEDVFETVTSVTHQVVTSESYTSPSSLQISHSIDSTSMGVLTTGVYGTETGKDYIVDFRIKVKESATNTTTINPSFFIEVLHGNANTHYKDEPTGLAQPYFTTSLSSPDLLSGQVILGSLGDNNYTLDSWIHVRIPYTEISGGRSAKLFITSLMVGNSHNYQYFIDDFTIKEQTFQSPGLNEELTINLPSYAQKALLDYVRAQASYEGGDLEKWDFFMKQFRSKLERWEDSRITGPRVLGPSSSSIR